TRTFRHGFLRRQRLGVLSQGCLRKPGHERNRPCLAIVSLVPGFGFYLQLKVMLSNESRILELVEEALNAQLTPEQVCAHEPELLADVKACLNECRGVELMIEQFFPATPVSGVSTPRPPAGTRVPTIPGYEVLEVLG